jgi:hypothetical protein
MFKKESNVVVFQENGCFLEEQSEMGCGRLRLLLGR